MRKIFLTVALLFGQAACAAPPSPPSTAPTTSPPILAAAPTPGPALTRNSPQTTIGGRTANIKEIVNSVQARGSADKKFESANVGLTLDVGGQARTAENSKARLDFVEGTIVRLGPTTVLTVEELASNNGSPLTRFQLELGKLWIALHGGTLDVKTPAGIVSVRGSYGIIEVFSDGTVRVVDLEGVFVHGGTTLGNMQGLSLTKEGLSQRFEVPPTFLIDFCDNNDESCKPLLNLLGIKSLDSFQNLKDNNPGQESPKTPPCTAKRGC